MHSFHYTDAARKLQDRFDTRNLADAELAVIVHDELTEIDKGFISAMEMFWLASVDDKGSPTVSFKGGAPGFVKVLDDRTLLFPNYDGNGMFLSVGNIDDSHKIGMLFIDLETPNRLRIQATASVSDDDELLSTWPGADLVVRARVEKVFHNCGRYIHKHERVSASKYVPAADGTVPGPTARPQTATPSTRPRTASSST